MDGWREDEGRDGGREGAMDRYRDHRYHWTDASFSSYIMGQYGGRMDGWRE